MAFGRLLLAWLRRDFRVRYTQTLLGSGWMLIQPLALTATFTFLFNGVTEVEVGAPYVAFAYTGMLLWILVSNGLAFGAASVASSMYIASKAAYPRVVAPISATLLSLGDLVLGLIALPFVLRWSNAQVAIHPGLLAGALLGTLFFVGGLATLLSAVAVFVRDVRNALPFAIQLGLLLSPIAYELGDVPARLRVIAEWNPVAVYATAWRSGILGLAPPSAEEWMRATGVTVAIALLGLAYFQAVQDRFPDVA